MQKPCSFLLPCAHTWHAGRVVSTRGSLAREAGRLSPWLGEAHPAQLARLSADHHGTAAEGHLSGSAQLPGPDHGALQPRECASIPPWVLRTAASASRGWPADRPGWGLLGPSAAPVPPVGSQGPPGDVLPVCGPCTHVAPLQEGLRFGRTPRLWSPCSMRVAALPALRPTCAEPTPTSELCPQPAPCPGPLLRARGAVCPALDTASVEASGLS